MISHTTEHFRKLLKGLPKHIQRLSRETYKQFKLDPYHPSLRFKRVHSTRPIFAVRINIDYRAVAIQKEDIMLWFWIGSHADYDNLLKRM